MPLESTVRNEPSPDLTYRLLSRAGYGPRPGELEEARALGREKWLERQLHPEKIDDAACERKIGALPGYFSGIAELMVRDHMKVGLELLSATVLRALYSQRQLYEAMVEFWSDHFCIFIRQNQFVTYLKVVDDREVIRPHALGTFRDLLFASARSPAMLVYLDNVLNFKANPNENYARELLELHSLGVDGGYSQQDVEELARILTGWTIHRRGPHKGEFLFDENEHDFTSKELLGKTYPEGRGEEEINEVLELLAVHPSTARFVSTKFVRRFVADDPPQDLVEKVSKTFLETKGDIKAMLRVIFLSEHFEKAPPKLKRPHSFTLSAIRALDVPVDPSTFVIPWLTKMGQPLFQWPLPNGYPDISDAWTSTLLDRWNFVLALAEKRKPGETAPALVKSIAKRVMGRDLPKDSLASLMEHVEEDPDDPHRESECVAALLTSPEFLWT